MIEEDIDEKEVSIGAISNEERVYQVIIAGEMRDFMNLDIRCLDHDAPCQKYTSFSVLWDNKPAHGMIATRIANNIQAFKVGPNIHELRYNVLMKRENILRKIYQHEQAMDRLHSATRQTASMIRGKIKKGEMLEKS